MISETFTLYYDDIFRTALANSTPLVHYSLILLGVEAKLAALPLILFLGSYPLLFTGLSVINLLNLGIVLRMWDLSLLGNAIIRELSFREYLQYMIAFKLPPRIITDPLPFEYIEKHRVPYKTVASISYLFRLLLSSSLKFFVYAAIIKHLRRTRVEWTPTPFAFSPISDIVDYYLLGLGLSMLMDIMTCFWFTIASLVLKIDYVPIMTNPFLATSIKNFWVNWNLIVQGSLRRIVFDPTMKHIFGHKLPIKKGQSIPAWHTTVAGLLTFIFSGLMHEWMIWCCLNLPSTSEQLVFFTLHGILSIVEVALKKTLKAATGFDFNQRVPWIIQLLTTQIGIAYISPLFMNAFINEQTYFHYGFA